MATNVIPFPRLAANDNHPINPRPAPALAVAAGRQ